jgi:membrane protein YqaA with SNARE-associated domain
MRIWMVAFFTAWGMLERLGGVGLVALGVIDSSLLPLPGSIDALTIVLAARDRELWPYYALMSTLGAVIGGYITYRLGRKGGKESLEKKFRKRQVERVYHFFEKWGFGAVFVPALLPPPIPFVPFLLAAGALNYSKKRFLIALIAGRGLRFTIVAYLGSIYGRRLFGFLAKYYQPILWTFLGLMVVGGLAALFYFLRKRRLSQGPQKKMRMGAQKDAAA